VLTTRCQVSLGYLASSRQHGNALLGVIVEDIQPQSSWAERPHLSLSACKFAVPESRAMSDAPPLIGPILPHYLPALQIAVTCCLPLRSPRYISVYLAKTTVNSEHCKWQSINGHTCEYAATIKLLKNLSSAWYV